MNKGFFVEMPPRVRHLLWEGWVKNYIHDHGGGGGVHHPGEADWLRPALGRPSPQIAGGPTPGQEGFSQTVFLPPFSLTSTSLFMELSYMIIKFNY
jgi:hypothetical protein